jgi:hypothetical protein
MVIGQGRPAILNGSRRNGAIHFPASAITSGLPIKCELAGFSQGRLEVTLAPSPDGNSRIGLQLEHKGTDESEGQEMAKRTALIAILPAAAICALSACGGSASPASLSAQAPAQTPQQQLASALVGGTDSTTGATVTSATVGAMCSASSRQPAYALAEYCNYDNDGITGIVPSSQWQNSGIYTTANGELQMSDGSQEVVTIDVDNQGNITWTSQN